MAFFKRHESHTKAYKAVFSVTVDTNNEYEESQSSNTNRSNNLIPDGKYWFGNKQSFATYDDIKDFVIGILNNDLKDECKHFLDIPVLDIKVRGVYEGSIELFLTVLFGVIAGVTGIKDLYDSIDFLQILAEKKLEKRLKGKYGDYFRIIVKKQIPHDTHYYNDHEYFYKHHVYIPQYSFNNKKIKRDSFFYYLLISNVVLVAMVVALVARAVIKIYF
jgi:hypothetical protein